MIDFEELKQKRNTEILLDMSGIKDYKYNPVNKCYYCYVHIKKRMNYTKHIKFYMPLYTRDFNLDFIIDYSHHIKNKIKNMI